MFATHNETGKRYRWDNDQWVETQTATHNETGIKYDWDGSSWIERAGENAGVEPMADPMATTAQQEPLRAPEPQGTNQNRFADFIDYTQGGFIGSIGADAKAVGYLTGSETASNIGDSLNQRAEEAQSTLSQNALDAQSKEFISSKDGELFGDAWGDVDSYIRLAGAGIGSLGAIVAGGGLTSIAAKAGLKVTAKAAAKAGAEKIAAGAAAAAGSRALPRAAYMSNEFLMAGGSTGDAVEQAVMNMPQETLNDSPGYVEILNEIRNSDEYKAGQITEDNIYQEARVSFAKNLATGATVAAGVPSMLLSAVSSKYIDDFISGRVQGGILRQAGIGAAVEGGTEAPQGATQQFVENLYVRDADQTVDLLDNVANAAVEEGIGGGIAGGSLAGGGAALRNALTDAPPEPVDTPPEPVVQPDAPADPVVPEVAQQEETAPPAEPRYTPKREDLLPTAGNKLDRGTRQDLERAREDILYRMNRIDDSPEQVEQRKDLPARQAKRQAIQQGKDLAAQQREALQDQLDRVNQQLEADQTARNAEADLSRMDQGLPPNQQYKPLEEIMLTKQFALEDTGEIVEITERADRLFSTMDKRRTMLTKLLECVG